ncbi:hypothetical protein ABP1_2241 [Bacillus subtilis]|nr:hypothetical protein ABP1_2241 [Bacillus subtilis]
MRKRFLLTAKKTAVLSALPFCASAFSKDGFILHCLWFTRNMFFGFNCPNEKTRSLAGSCVER